MFDENKWNQKEILPILADANTLILLKILDIEATSALFFVIVMKAWVKHKF